MDRIDANSEVFKLAINEYLGGTSLKQTRIMQDFNLEVDVRDEYRGRELYELIQNADDQGAPKMAISLNSDQNTLTVSNAGTPFSEDGFLSIMRANDSTKLLLKKIGQKGLGFRSVLNWAEEIEIRSAGVVCRFSAEIAERKWKEEICSKFRNDQKLSSYEDIARQKGRNCPLAILAVPDVSEDKTDMEDDYVTTIKLTLRSDTDSVLESIRSQMESLRDGRVLLFLPHLTELTVDGYSISKRRENKDVVLNGQRWKIKEVKSDDYSQVAVAYPLDDKVKFDNNTLYCFFPTMEVNPYPCLVHAAFRLGQSRNYLIDDLANDALIDRCAEQMIQIATEMSFEDPWKRVRMVYTDQPVIGRYQKKLEERLLGWLKKTRLFPVVTNDLISGEEARFVSPGLSLVVQDALDKVGNFTCFNQMLTDPGTLDLCKLNVKEYTVRELSEGLTELSKQLDSQFELRAKLIKSLVEGVSEGMDPKPALLVDGQGQIIEKTAYLIASERIPKTPDWLEMKPVHPDLYEKLKQAFDIKGGTDNPGERQLTTRLEKHLNVKYADKNTVVRELAPTSDSEDSRRIRDRVKALFEYYRGDDEGTNDIVLTRTKVYLLNKEGEPMESSRLVLHGDDISVAWQLMGTQEWGINESVPNDVVAAFWRRLHVSDYLPMVMKDIVADSGYMKALNICGTTGENKVDNYPREQYAWVPDSDFSKSQDLKSFMRRILLEKTLYERVTGKQSLRYYHWGENKKEFPLSYPAYYIRNLEVLSQLQGYVCQDVSSLDDRILSYDEAVKAVGQDFSKSDYLSFLVKLGAKRFEDFSVKELYDKLKDDIGKREDYRGVMREYQQIRRALEVKKGSVTDEERLKMLEGLQVFASMKGNVVKVDHADAYYWDYDRLPARLSSELPKLYIGNRVGAESVSKLFGVKRGDQLKIEVHCDPKDECSSLEGELQGMFSKKIPYLLSVRCRNAMNDLDKYYGALCSMVFKIYKKVSVAIDDKMQDLGPFEMINKEDDFFFCCPSGNSLEAVAKDAILKQVDFWENVAEAVCIKLDVRGDGMMSSFRNILKGNELENEVLRNKEIPLDVWQDVLKAMGMPDKEKDFWLYLSGDDAWVKTLANPLTRAYFIDQRFKTDFSSEFSGRRMPGIESLLDNEQIFRLLWNLHTDKPDAATYLSKEEGLSRYYLKQLRSIREEWEGRYRSKLYRELCNEKNQQANYLDRVQEYLLTDDLLSDIAKEKKNDYVQRKDLVGAFLERTGIRRDEEAINYTFLDKYKQGYSELIGDLDDSLFSNRLRSLLLFPDNEEDIQKHLTKLREKEATGPRINDQNVKIRFGSFLRESPPEESQGGGSGGFVSEKTMKRAGKRAEELVKAKLSSLEGVEEFEPVSAYSRVDGIDARHVDFLYTYNGERHMLEVKSMSGNQIIMSKAEYTYALKNSRLYDFAIVSGERITIWQHPFLDSVEAYPHSYELYLSEQDDK